VARLNLEADGGVKIPLAVPFASINRYSKVQLRVERAGTADTAAIKEGKFSHPTQDEYRRRNKIDPLPGRFNERLDSLPSSSTEHKKQNANITTLLGMLEAKKKAQDAEK
jgi:hypothetical protein